MIGIVWHGLRDALLMAWGIWWALVLGFAISAVVQAWVPRDRVEAALGDAGPAAVARATGLGAASSSCSYAAVAIARSLFAKGASATAALAFQFASTNLVWELGLVLWLLIGWQFAVAEYLGGLLMIALMTAGLRVFVSPRVEQRARRHAERADDDGGDVQDTGRSWRERVTSREAWAQVARTFASDWRMLWKEIAVGVVLAGFVAQVGDDALRSLFLVDAPEPLPTIENVIAGPLIAMLSFVCSVGNVPLAAVLWTGGISFAGVLAFLFADLVILPIVAIYRKYYGDAYALRITALMLATMPLAALAIGGLFGLAGALPASRPSREDLFGGVRLDYKAVLNVVGLAVFATLMTLATRRAPDREDRGAA